MTVPAMTIEQELLAITDSLRALSVETEGAYMRTLALGLRRELEKQGVVLVSLRYLEGLQQSIRALSEQLKYAQRQL